MSELTQCPCKTCLRYIDFDPLPDGSALVYCMDTNVTRTRHVDMDRGCSAYEEREAES